MPAIVARFSTTFEIWNAFLTGKVEINNHILNKVKINNLKTTKDLGVITKDEFKINIISILDMELKIPGPTMCSWVSILVTHDLIGRVHASLVQEVS
jgi:hypothetical protein